MATDAAFVAARPRSAVASWVTATAVLATTVAAFALARAVLLPDVGLWDTAEYQTVPPLLGTLHPTGFPAYVVLGWLASAVLAPFGSPAFRMDLLSAILLGLAAGGTALLVVVLTGRIPLGVVAGLGLAVTPIAWRIGTRADAHALQLALLPWLLLALVAWEQRTVQAIEGEGPGAEPVRRSHAAEGTPRPAVGGDGLLLLAAVLLGLGLANHRLTLLLLPGIAAFVVRVDPGIVGRRRFLAGCGGLALLVAAALYLELPVRAGPLRAPIVYADPATFTGFWYVVLGVQFGGTLLSSLSDPLAELASLATLAADNLGLLAVALPAVALVVVATRPRYALLTGPAMMLICLFAAGYTDADIGRYYLGPALIAWTWLALGAGWLLDRIEAEIRGRSAPAIRDGGSIARVARAGTRPLVARIGPVTTVLVVGAIAATILPTLPGRWSALADEVRNASGRPWLDAALGTMAPGAVVVSWWDYSTPLWYGQLIEGRRTDVRVIDDRTRLDEGLGDVIPVIDANLGHRTVYTIRIDPAERARIARRYRTTSIPLPGGPPLVRIDAIRDPAA